MGYQASTKSLGLRDGLL